LKSSLFPKMESEISQGHFILGSEVEKFEHDFSSYLNASYCVGLDNGSTALEFALRALGIGPGDEVIAPAHTFIATVCSISFTGARPVLVDVDPQSYNLDAKLLERAITSKTKAVLPVHLYGQPADMDEILSVASKYNLKIVEDACQAHGAFYKGRRVGTFGSGSAFSFYPGKNLGAFGDAGALVTNDLKIADFARGARNYGQKEKYHHLTLAWNRRLDSLQATVLNEKLKHLDDWNKARADHAKKYSELLSGVEKIRLPKVLGGRTHIFHLYVIQVEEEKRDALQKFLLQREIETGIHYPIPVHLQPAYKDLGCGVGSFPVAESVSKKILSLPMFPELKEEEIDYVAESIKEFFAKNL